MILPGTIQAYDGEYLHITAPYRDVQTMVHQKIDHCEVLLKDGRQLSALQRNKIFALIKDITNYVSGGRKDTEFMEQLTAMQLRYVYDLADSEAVRAQLTYQYCQASKIDLFSLANRGPDTVDMTTAGDFIDWLVELCIEYGIPCTDTLLNRCEDQQRYLYACVMNRVCCICGKRADIHEYDKVGMGRNRAQIHHTGQRVQPLCREHHQEEERLGQKAFDRRYCLTWVTLDERACKKLNWKE